MSLLFSVMLWQFFMHFCVAFHFFKLTFDFSFLPKAAFCKDKAYRGTPKGGKTSLPFISNGMAFFMHFYVPFHFFKVPFDFASVPKAVFWKCKAHRGTPKVGKMSFLCFSNRTAFFHAIHLFKVSFDFVSVPKAAFSKSKAHRGTPKVAKMSLPFFSNRTAFFHAFLGAISFFKTLSILNAFRKQHFARLNYIGVPPNKEKGQFFFFLIEWHFFMHFYVPSHFFKVLFDFACLPKAAFFKDKAHRVTPKAHRGT